MRPRFSSERSPNVDIQAGVTPTPEPSASRLIGLCSSEQFDENGPYLEVTGQSDGLLLSYYGDADDGFLVEPVDGQAPFWSRFIHGEHVDFRHTSDSSEVQSDDEQALQHQKRHRDVFLDHHEELQAFHAERWPHAARRIRCSWTRRSGSHHITSTSAQLEIARQFNDFQEHHKAAETSDAQASMVSRSSDQDSVTQSSSLLDSFDCMPVSEEATELVKSVIKELDEASDRSKVTSGRRDGIQD